MMHPLSKERQEQREVRREKRLKRKQENKDVECYTFKILQEVTEHDGYCSDAENYRTENYSETVNIPVSDFYNNGKQFDASTIGKQTLLCRTCDGSDHWCGGKNVAIVEYIEESVRKPSECKKINYLRWVGYNYDVMSTYLLAIMDSGDANEILVFDYKPEE